MATAEDILFGSDNTKGVVAVEVLRDAARLYIRSGDSVTTEDRPFERWLLATEKHDLANARWTELEGEGYRWLAEFADRESYQNARFFLRDAHALHIAVPDPAKQFLMRSGVTLFKGMAFDDIHRLQLDIETATLAPDTPESRILLVAISDNRGFETIISGDELDILRKTVECVRELDPDVIEGHNLYEFDLKYLAARAKAQGVRLAFGRDGSEIGFGPQQSCAIGYFAKPFTPPYIHGRHAIDTLLAVQRFDVGKGALSSHGLKAVAQALGVAEDSRELIPHDQISAEWRSNPDRVRKYALQDVRETRSIAEIVCPPDFYLTQMAPDIYSRVATTGTGEKINSIFIREYLRKGRAIPRQMEPKPLPGGYTEVRTTGLIERIVKCDVESLYPSLMLTRKIAPASDTLGVFLPALEELTQRRFAAKRRAKETEGREHAYWDGMQNAFKILINSFYGYLGGPFNFNDYDAAAQVTTSGQAIVKLIVAELERTGSTVVEVDTDGVYFRPPECIEDEAAESAYVERIGEALPEGIRLAHDGRYRAMISLKMKNYVLLSYDGKKVFKGSSLRSRADERFGLEFISKASDYLLQGRKEDARRLYQDIARRISAGDLPVESFARRERITEKTFSAASKKRIAQAVAGARIGEYVSVYQRADGSIGLVQYYSGDEDREYLLEKLYKFALRLREAFGEDFDALFPKPSRKSRSEAAGQQTLGLFD
jgi:DNA polymerase I